ncbi:peroxidase family protein [Nitrospira moscoviensis]|uniref:Myeloperoxidase, thyroid peroxidase, cyclooxygenase catalytic domain n=1 Tax=Nitrospira moscoviensis TaxID=42253 RepID=A0A0K2GCX1_NITMO|nr:heme peroxidase family protein [Nitrospira moscoviensis]ALA58805.1 Myeloperoxidase, thyroid peroxidase, cyclooxygenase catalytic domain [Nitrospira moscoviensis]
MLRPIDVAVKLCLMTVLWSLHPFTPWITDAQAQTVEVTQPERPSRPEDVFVRLFPGLPPFAPPTDDVREQVKKFGQKGGAIDAKDLLTDPIQSILNPSQHSPQNPDNPNMTAGMTFLGQFIDHDLTFDLKSALLQKTEPRQTTNFRTAAFDLDSVYGNGPQESPRLYEASSGVIKMRVDPIPGSEAVSRKGAPRFDLPRDASLQAIIGDSRNDENVVISQLHVAMLRFHNAVTDHLSAQPSFAGQNPTQVFEAAQRLVRWHYQWIVLHEFLPATIGRERVDDILRRGEQFYNLHAPPTAQTLRNSRGNPMIPIEFSAAAYRFGHSQVRPSYRINFGTDGAQPVFLFTFDDTADPNDPDPNDLRGGKRASRRFVDWQTFFDFGDGNVRSNKKIDGKLSSVLMELPGSRGIAPGLPPDGVQSLASRNLMRHVNFGLPSGQAIARVMGEPVLSAEQLADAQPFGLERSTPLWFYILKEAELLEGGTRLGPVGGRIVGEVFIGLLKADQSSFLAAEPNWRPTLPSATPGDFRMTDLLKFAGVVPPLD